MPIAFIGDSAPATRGRERERERHRQTDRRRERDRERERERERKICTQIKVTGKFVIELRFQNAIILGVAFWFVVSR